MSRGSEIRGVLWASRIRIVALVALLSLQLSVVLSQGGQTMTFPAEKDALLKFRNALQDPDNHLQLWDSTTDPCLNWTTTVFCSQQTTSQGSTTYLHVIELRLFNMNLGGTLVPELGNLSFILNLDVMWNRLTGPIPPSLGNLASLQILALNGNNLSGTIPTELGKLSNMNRIQLDGNQLSGPVPSSFGSLPLLAHLHLNNNSLSGSIPKELGQCPSLIHILLDNNKLTGQMPEEIANATTLVIIQLDNNQLGGFVPVNYTNKLINLSKLSCRNCGLTGSIPDLSNLPNLYFIDLSHNNLNGSFPVDISTKNITTVNFSYNQLVGTIPTELTTATTLQALQVSNNILNGSIPDLTQQIYSASKNDLLMDFQNNSFQYVSLGMITDAANMPQQIDLRLFGNPSICTGSRYIPQLDALCQPVTTPKFQSQGDIQAVPRGGPIVVTYRLKSPSFTYFTPAYELHFTEYIAGGLKLQPDQVSVQSFEWQTGPRLLMIMLINPPVNAKFNDSEVERIKQSLSNWDAGNSTVFGPYELLGFFYLGAENKLSKGAIAGITVGSVAGLLIICLLVALFILHKRSKQPLSPRSKRRAQMLSLRHSQQSLLKITGVFAFSYSELAKATDDFSDTKMVGRGGYGNVYRGVLESGQVVAIKRANFEAIQRNTEFYNEIELLSRCHHRNLVALVGYCNDEEEQMLVYEFMEGGTLHQHLHADAKDSLNFLQRLKIALGSAKGILYLHTEANPPIFHRDIKSNNILLDLRNQAKVADFGLSRLAPDIQDDVEGDETQSHVSTVVKGTPGYLDPEYFLTRKLTDKSDVYSFGVVLLELITGMHPITCGKNIVRESRAAFDDGEMLRVIDQNMGSFPSEVMDPFIVLAMSCVDSDTNARPSMMQVTRTLDTLMVNLHLKGGALSDMLSMDITRDDFSVQLKKEEKLGDNSTSTDTGFDTGGTSTGSPNSSKTSPYFSRSFSSTGANESSSAFFSRSTSTGASKLFTPFYSRFYRLDPASER